MQHRPHCMTELKEAARLYGLVALLVTTSFLLVGLSNVLQSGPTVALPVETAQPPHYLAPVQ